MTRTARSVFLGATAVVVATLTGVGESRAVTPLDDIYAGGNVACIGKDPDDGKTKIVWQIGGIPMHICTPRDIGDSNGLWDDYVVSGREGWDYLKIGCSLQCGGIGAPFKTWTADFAWGGHYIDIAGNEGDDWLQNSLSTGGLYIDTWFFGDAGHDWISSESSIGRMLAHDGNDILESNSAVATGEWLDGGPGNDCLKSSGIDPAYYDCGSGDDRYKNWTLVTTNCETILWAGASCH